MDVLDQATEYVNLHNKGKEEKPFDVVPAADTIGGRYVKYRNEKILYISATRFVCITILNAKRLNLLEGKSNDFMVFKYNHPFKVKLSSKYYHDIGKILDMLVGLYNQ